MSLLEIHARLANTSLLFAFFMAIWGAWRFIRKQGIPSSYWGAVVIMELLILLQGVLGMILYIDGARPDRGVHILYGIASALALPMVFAYTRGRDQRPDMLMYVVAFLFLIGLFMRAITTAMPV